MESFSLNVALRYLRASSENRYFSWISFLSIAGIAIGVATMIVVLSVINGFETELTNRFLNANAHIMLYRYPSGLKDPVELMDKIKKDYASDITGVSPFVHFESMAKHSSMIHTVLIRGIDPDLRESVQSLRPWLEDPSSLDKVRPFKEIRSESGAGPAILGEGVVKILSLKMGDEFSIISPSDESGAISKRFYLAGIYHSGLKIYDNRLIVLSTMDASDLLGLDKRVTGVEIGLKRPFSSPEIAESMAEKYGLSVRQWQSFNENMIKALKSERAVIFLVICLVGVVASFNILTTLFVAVTLKQRQISLLKALGANYWQILKIFLFKGAFMGFIGAGAGILIALIISKVLETYQFIDLPEPYYLTRLPVEYDFKVYLTLGVVGILVSVAAAVLPAISASRVLPVLGLKGGTSPAVVKIRG